MIIGVDPHKGSHTATALDAVTNTAVSSVRVDATIGGYRQLLRWARQFGERRWAVENARGLGCHLAQWLVAPDEVVLDASTARVRELSRGGRRKNDVIDVAAAASVAALQGDASVVAAEDETVVFALLEERRANLAAQRVRSPTPAPRPVERPDSGRCTDGTQDQHSGDASPQRSAPRHHQRRPARPWHGTWYGRSEPSTPDCRR